MTFFYRMSQKSDFQNAAKAEESQPKLSATGLNHPMDMTWERLILLCLTKKRQKNFQMQARPGTVERGAGYG